MALRLFNTTTTGVTVRRTLISTVSRPVPSVYPLAALSTTSIVSSSSRPEIPNQHSSSNASGPSGPSGTVPDAQLSDPYPLPFSPDIVNLNNPNTDSNPESKWKGLNLASDHQTLDTVNAPMRVPGREDEDRDTKLARLVYQCRKRGTLETDLLLSTFAKKELHSLPTQELDELDRLLDEPDWDIFYWCTQRKPIPDRWAESFKTQGKLGWRLVQHTKNDEKTVRWMPEL